MNHGRKDFFFSSIKMACKPFQRSFFTQLMLQDELAIYAKGGNEFSYFKIFSHELHELTLIKN